MAPLEPPQAQELLADAVVSVAAVRHGLEPRTAFWPGSLPLFYRQEQRDPATLVIRGRLSGLERTTAEPNAHQAGRPDRAAHGHLQLGGRVPGRNEAARIEAWCHRTKTLPPRRLIPKGAAGASSPRAGRQTSSRRASLIRPHRPLLRHLRK
jgi:hypothetical protein